jgi:queuosine precursor transporter
MKIDARLGLFVVLVGVFVTSLIVGDIIGGKLFIVPLFGHDFTVSSGLIPFPITFLLTDLLNEFYGKRAARFVTWTGLGMAAFTFLILFIATQIPFAPFTAAADWKGVNESSFNNIFASSQRIIFASLTAYTISQFIDIGIFHVLKRMTGDKHLWLRATGSTVVSQMIDTAVINTIFWWGVLPFGEIVALAATAYVIKLLVAIGLTPLIYVGHAGVERYLGLTPVVLDKDGEPTR